MRLFLDTNVLIDLFTLREPEGRSIERLIALTYFGDAELWASAKSYTDIFYVMRRSGFDGAAIHRAFRASFDWVNLCSIQSEDVKLAVEREWPDFEDCVVAIAAEKVKADYLVTRDRGGFAQSKVDPVSPRELFEMLERDHGLIYASVDWNWD